MAFLSSFSNKFHSGRGIAMVSDADPAAPAATPTLPDDQTAAIAEAALDAIGRNNEEMRDQFLQIVRKSEDMLTLRSDLIVFAEHVGAILQQNEAANSNLVERSVMLALEEHNHNEMKARYRALHEENESNERKVSLLTAEVERYGELVQSRERRINAIETELTSERDNTLALRSELDELRIKSTELGDQLDAAQAELSKSDALIASMHIDTAAVSTKLSVAEFHLAATKSSLAESQGEAKTLRDMLGHTQRRESKLSLALQDADVELENRRTRLVTLESALTALQHDQDEAKLSAQRQAEGHSDEVAKLKNEIDELSSRVNSNGQLHDEALTELQTKTSELRKAERRTEELEAKIGALEERARISEQENATLSSAVDSMKGSYVRLSNRSHALLRGMKDQKAKLETAEHRARLLEERLSSEAAQFDKVVSQLRSTIQQLTERIEQEKVARHVASGALEAARNRSLIDADASLLEILARASDGEARSLRTPGVQAIGLWRDDARQANAESTKAPTTAPDLLETTHHASPGAARTRQLRAKRKQAPSAPDSGPTV